MTKLAPYFAALFVALLASPSAIAEIIPLPQALQSKDQFIYFATDSLSRDLRIQLATHFPKIFPIHFLCRYEPPAGEGLTVVPGEWVNALQGGEMKCPGLLSAKLATASRFRISQLGSQPVLMLESGNMKLSLLDKPFTLSTSGMSLKTENLGKELLMEMMATPSLQWIACSRGNMQAQLQFVTDKKIKKYLASHVCAMRLEYPDFTRHLFSRDTVAPEDIFISRALWPAISEESLTQFQKNPEITQSFYFEIKNPDAKTGPYQVGWNFNAGGLDTNLSCAVYSQETEISAPIEVQRISSAPGKPTFGEIPFQENSFGNSLSAVCQLDKMTIASQNLVNSRK